jgi:homoserine dehydrogenase
LVVWDKPLVLGQIATIFGRHEVSLAAMEMKTLGDGLGEIVFLTHPAVERSFREALLEIDSAEMVNRIGNAFRVAD